MNVASRGGGGVWQGRPVIKLWTGRIFMSGWYFTGCGVALFANTVSVSLRGSQEQLEKR